VSLPKPPRAYDEQDQIELRRLIDQALAKCLKSGVDIELGTARLIVTRINGTRAYVQWNNDGTVETVAL
jgi:hypothetical protein